MHLASKQPAHPLDHTFKRLPENLVCFSHLRWDFVFQRPQHLLTRLSRLMNVFYMEEPIQIAVGETPHYVYHKRGDQLTMICPHIPEGLNHQEAIAIQEELLKKFLSKRQINDYGFWYYTPMALEFTRKFTPSLTVFDCMDELSAFKFAPASIKSLEQELFQKADIVFTGGYSLFEAKKHQHKNIHAIPSSIDKTHFAKTRALKKEAERQQHNNLVKLGFYGVIDERFDIELIGEIANLRPQWDINLIGPVVKIDSATLPVNSNIHYIGPKTYQQLPEIMADWDIALIPFFLNESTKFISPTKTPEYLAAGLPVVATAIRDVVNPYGRYGLVSIANSAAQFVEKAEFELNRPDKQEWLQKVDFFLAHNSWDITCERMVELLLDALPPSPAIYNTFIQS